MLIPELERHKFMCLIDPPLGMMGTHHLLPAKPFHGAIGTEGRMSLQSVDKSNFQLLKLVVVINTVGIRFM